jgi:DNA-binding CsgD family transcriptional regulator
VEHLRARAILALILASRGDPSVAMAYADAAVEAAERAGDPGELAYALWVRTVASFATTDTAADVEACAQAAAASAQPESECLACLARSDWLGGQGRLAEAARVLIDGHAVAQQKGLGGLTAYLATYAAHCLLVCGPTGQAERLLRQVLATRPTGILGAQAHGAMAVVAVRQDRLSEAASHQAAAEELVPQYAHQPEVHGAVPTAEFLLAAGEVEEALGTLTATIGGHATADPRFADTMLLWGARAAARLANLQDDPGPARAALQTLLGARHAAPVPAFSDLSVPFHRATRLLYEAEKSELDDDIDPTERWRAAADLCAATDARYETVRAMLGLATSRARRGRRQEAAGPLREAHHLARALEAPQLARQAEQVASAARISLLVPSAVPQGQVASVGPLTPREVEVLRHLVAGRSYTEIAGALFISPKTVGVHVSNLLRKTGTTNRIDAAMWARAHGMAP